MRTGCLRDADLLHAVARAASLDERRGGARLAAATADQVTSRLAQWREHVAGGDEHAFSAYLAEAGLTPREAAALMSDVALPTADEVPSWAHTLADIAARARAGGDAGDPAAVPFGHLWTAAAGAARQAVISRLGAQRRGLLTPGALDQLTGCFLADVAQLGSRAVYEAFTRFRRRLDDDGETADAYQRFVSEQRAAGLPVLITRYPVLGRLVAQRADDLAAATAELLARLRADRGALAAAFWPSGDPGRVSAIRFGMGDRHCRGRTVARVSFEHGLVLAYKPRPVGAEAGLHRLLARLDEAGLAGPLAPVTVERAGYGWTAWITRRDCADEAELAGYYRRAGTLLALSWLLGSRDLHAENIVAAGPAPAIVDAEMTSPPSPVPALLTMPGQLPAQAEVAARLRDSVAATGLLPAWMAIHRDGARDLSGLTGSYPGGGLAWASLNTAGMVPVTEPLPLARTENAPTRDDAATVAAGRLSDLISGYETADRWLGRHKSLVATQVAGSGLFTAPARITLRPTQAYASLLAYAGRAALLGDGLTRSLALDAVSYRPWWPPVLANLHASDPAAARRVTAAERRALERGDIPLFLASPAERDLVTECGMVPGVFTGAPVARLLDRLDRIGARHRHEQVLYTRGTFEGHWRASPRRATSPAAPRHPAARALGRAARQLADGVTDSAVRAGGTVSWPLVIQGDGPAGRPGLEPIGIDLYSGRAGLGVFLAASAVHWGDDGLAGLARDCVIPIAGAVRSAGPAGLGGALSGAASAVYGLALTAELLGDATLTRDARRAAAHLAAQAVAPAGPGPWPECGAGDVSGGLAGAALALCAAAGHGAGAPAVTAAVRIAERALAGDLTRPVPAAADGGGDLGLRAGIAHGLSGTALALHRVSVAAGEARLARAAATAAAAADAALASAAPAGQLTSRWCRGAAGVAAAAIAMGRHRDSPLWTRGIGHALARARQPGPLRDASACCGRGGEIELLSLAGEQRAAQSLATTVIPAAREDWALGRWPGIVPLLPGFHRGAAGLGYTFLRALSPDRFPSVLAWE